MGKCQTGGFHVNPSFYLDPNLSDLSSSRHERRSRRARAWSCDSELYYSRLQASSVLLPSLGTTVRLLGVCATQVLHHASILNLLSSGRVGHAYKARE